MAKLKITAYYSFEKQQSVSFDDLKMFRVIRHGTGTVYSGEIGTSTSLLNLMMAAKENGYVNFQRNANNHSSELFQAYHKNEPVKCDFDFVIVNENNFIERFILSVPEANIKYMTVQNKSGVRSDFITMTFAYAQVSSDPYSTGIVGITSMAIGKMFRDANR